MRQRLRHFRRIPVDQQLRRCIARPLKRLSPGGYIKRAARIFHGDQLMAFAKRRLEGVRRRLDGVSRQRPLERLILQEGRVPGRIGFGQPGVVQGDHARGLPIAGLVVRIGRHQILRQIRAQKVENPRER